LLNFLLSNCTWDDGEVVATLRDPFDLLAKTNLSDVDVSTSGSGNSAKTEIWLGNQDSNLDKQSQSLLCYRYTIPQNTNVVRGLFVSPARRRGAGAGHLLAARSPAWQARKAGANHGSPPHRSHQRGLGQRVDGGKARLVPADARPACQGRCASRQEWLAHAAYAIVAARLSSAGPPIRHLKDRRALSANLPVPVRHAMLIAGISGCTFRRLSDEI